MFDKHEIIYSENAKLENFYAGEHVLNTDRQLSGID